MAAAGVGLHGKEDRREIEAAPAAEAALPQPVAHDGDRVVAWLASLDELNVPSWLTFVRESATLHAWLEEIGFESRLVSSERLISALRARKTAEELART